MQKRGFLVILALLACLFHPQVHAQTRIVVSNPERKFPIALPPLCRGDKIKKEHQGIPDTVSRDLEFSGYFETINPEAYVTRKSECEGDYVEDYSDWKLIKASWLVRGNVSSTGKQLSASLYLHDVATGKIVLGKRYSGPIDDPSIIAHRFANEVMKYITGESGPFGSKIAVVGKTGRFKELFLMDMDGENIRQLTSDKGLSLSPSFHPSGKSIVFTSYRRRVPDLFIYDLGDTSLRPFTRNDDLEIGAHFSPDGTRLITSISGRRDSDLVIFDNRGRTIKRLGGSNSAIEVSPSYSPDGRFVAFCSDRRGSPQIYVSDIGSGQTQRISFVKSSYCTSPSWSPQGDKVAFVCRADGGYQVFISEPDGSRPVQVTAGGDNEDPSWSPDGRYLAYASTFGRRTNPFNIAIMRIGKGQESPQVKKITSSRSGFSEPSWGPIP